MNPLRCCIALMSALVCASMHTAECHAQARSRRAPPPPGSPAAEIEAEQQALKLEWAGIEKRTIRVHIAAMDEAGHPIASVPIQVNVPGKFGSLANVCGETDGEGICDVTVTMPTTVAISQIAVMISMEPAWQARDSTRKVKLQEAFERLTTEYSWHRGARVVDTGQAKYTADLRAVPAVCGRVRVQRDPEKKWPIMPAVPGYRMFPAEPTSVAGEYRIRGLKKDKVGYVLIGEMGGPLRVVPVPASRTDIDLGSIDLRKPSVNAKFTISTNLPAQECFVDTEGESPGAYSMCHLLSTSGAWLCTVRMVGDVPKPADGAVHLTGSSGDTANTDACLVPGEYFVVPSVPYGRDALDPACKVIEMLLAKWDLDACKIPRMTLGPTENTSLQLDAAAVRAAVDTAYDAFLAAKVAPPSASRP